MPVLAMALVILQLLYDLVHSSRVGLNSWQRRMISNLHWTPAQADTGQSCFYDHVLASLFHHRDFAVAR